MGIHSKPFHGAGKTFRVISADDALTGRPTIRVEDYYDRVLEGEFWTTPVNNWVGRNYFLHQAAMSLPMDEEIVYGKDEYGFAFAVHVTELGDELAELAR